MDPMDIIVKEFPFVNFELHNNKGSDIEYFFKTDNVAICITYEKEVRLLIKPLHYSYTISKDSIIEDLYKYLPKEFYLPYQRDETIDNILK